MNKHLCFFVRKFHTHRWETMPEPVTVVIAGDALSSYGMSAPVCCIRKCSCGSVEVSHQNNSAGNDAPWVPVIGYTPVEKKLRLQTIDIGTGELNVYSRGAQGRPIVSSLR
jgi:hypothetical protein